ncbi:Protein YLS9 [Carex littledalei]|uniref:Protein YLS9 n=1 Tax=Carex littledalei TaxID=544730 RepID=A0A833RII2_9POAL|nr:Protein YLS9 [Carex littledalei]
MSSSYQPSYATYQPQQRQQPQQTSRRRYIAHRVKESLTSRFAKCLCSLVLSLLLIVAVIMFILWLNLRPHRPRFYLSSFSAPGLAQSTSPVNSAFTFNVTDRNSNGKIGIYYDSIYASVLYNDNQIASAPVLSPFYQPSKNTTVILGTLTAVGPNTTDPIWDHFSADVATGQVRLVLKLTSKIRFQVKMWDTRQHNLHVECDLTVGQDGNVLSQYVNERCTVYF